MLQQVKLLLNKFYFPEMYFYDTAVNLPLVLYHSVGSAVWIAPAFSAHRLVCSFSQGKNVHKQSIKLCDKYRNEYDLEKGEKKKLKCVFSMVWYNLKSWVKI